MSACSRTRKAIARRWGVAWRCGVCCGSIDFRMVGTDQGAHHSHPMSDGITPEPEVICPVCGQTMTFLHRLRSAFDGTFDEFRCKSCNYRTTLEVKMGKPG